MLHLDLSESADCFILFVSVKLWNFILVVEPFLCVLPRKYAFEYILEVIG